MATNIYYFSNSYNAIAAFNSGTPIFTNAIYQDSSSNSIQNWGNTIVNGANNGESMYYGDASGNAFGWTIAYSDPSGSLVADGSWIQANGTNAISGVNDVTSGAYAGATILILCPAFYDYTTNFSAGSPGAGLAPISIGVLSYHTGKTPITDAPDSITASGLIGGDASTFYATEYLATDNWEVSERINLNGTSTAINTIITAHTSLVDSTSVLLSFNQGATVYFLTQAPLVCKLSFYDNLTDATAGIDNDDNYRDISGASIDRIAYSLTSNSGSQIGMVDGGSIGAYQYWSLLDSSGNAYVSNPLYLTQSMPVSASNWYLYPYVVGAYFSYYSDVSGANAGVANNDEVYDVSGASAGRIAYSAASSATAIGTVVSGGGNISGTSSWSVLDSSGNLLAGGPYDNGEDSSDFFPASSSLAFYLYPAEVVSVLSYYSNYNDAIAGAANNDCLTSTLGGATNRFAYSLVDISGTIGNPIDGGSIGTTTGWTLYDTSGTALGGSFSNNAAIPAGSSAWYLTPELISPYFSYYSDISGANSGVINNDGSTNTTVAGFSTYRIALSPASSSTAIGDIEIGGDISGYTSWNVLDESGNLLAGGPYNNGDTSGNFTPSSVSTKFYLYPYEAPNVVSVLSYYSNYTDAAAGAASDDYLTSTLGGATNRFAYTLADISGTIGNPIDGGSIESTNIWYLYDTSGNQYSGNPVSNNAPIPIESIAWYLFPSGMAPYFSYYSDASGANAGVINLDGIDNVPLAGTSTYRIAYSSDSPATPIGEIQIGGNIFGYTSWNVLDSSGNLLAGGPYDNGDTSGNFTPSSVSTNFYLYPYEPPVVAYFSYYSNVSDANAGVDNNDELYDVSGASAGRIAYSAASSATAIGTVVDGSGNISATTSWNVLDTSGNLVPGGPYNNTEDSSDFGYYGGDSAYFLYPYIAQAPCFLEGSLILCLVDEKETYLPIEKMRKGTFVKTLNSGYKMVHIIGKRDIPNFNDSNRIKDRLYKLTSAQYPALTSDLYLTGCHSTLVDSLTDDQKDKIKKMLSVVCVTEGKYRLPACLDNNAEPWQSKGTYTVWHFALDDEDPLINFGVYANGGLIVETGSIRYLQGKANMELV